MSRYEPRQRQLRGEREAAGVCLSCPGSADHDAKYCAKCRRGNVERAAKARAKRNAQVLAAMRDVDISGTMAADLQTASRQSYRRRLA